MSMDAKLRDYREFLGRTNANIGHGYVFPRPDGAIAKCGGPALCAECARDLAIMNAMKGYVPPTVGEMIAAIDAQAARIEAQDIIVSSVASALARHGVKEADDPGDAIDVLVADKDAEIKRLRAVLQDAERVMAQHVFPKPDAAPDHPWNVLVRVRETIAALQGESK